MVPVYNCTFVRELPYTGMSKIYISHGALVFGKCVAGSFYEISSRISAPAFAFEWAEKFFGVLFWSRELLVKLKWAKRQDDASSFPLPHSLAYNAAAVSIMILAALIRCNFFHGGFTTAFGGLLALLLNEYSTVFDPTRSVWHLKVVQHAAQKRLQKQDHEINP